MSIWYFILLIKTFVNFVWNPVFFFWDYGVYTEERILDIFNEQGARTQSDRLLEGLIRARLCHTGTQNWEVGPPTMIYL